MIHDRRTVCLPRLSVMALAVARLSLQSRLEAYFDDYPLYAKALTRWLRVPESWFLSLAGAVAGGPVRRLPRGGDLADKGRLILHAMQTTSDICEVLEPSIDASPWTEYCADFLEKDSALAAVLKRFAYQNAWPLARTLVVARSVVPEGIPVTLIGSPLLPQAWTQICAPILARERVQSFFWPPSLANSWSAVVASAWAARIAASALFAVSRQGVRPASQKPSAVVAIDLADPRRMGGGSADYDHWIDDRRLRREDVLYFSLARQRKLIKSTGFNFDGAISRLSSQGYRIVELRRLPLTPAAVRGIIGSLRKTPAFSRDAACLGPAAHAVWVAYLSYLPLFERFSPRNVTHCTNPNGFAPLNLDSGVITGLCRRRGSRGVGYQNRAIYDTFEYDHECYDLLLAWAAAWWDSRKTFLRHVRSVAEVGSPTIAGADSSGAGAGKTMVVFTTDPEGSHWTIAYHHRLLRSCLTFARRHPHDHVIVKTKDIEDIDLFLADEEFRRECEANPNFTFTRLARSECAEILRKSDVAVSAAYGSPGADALLAGKPTVFYSEMGRGCEALDSLPGVVARTPAELEEFIERARSSLERPISERAALLRGLDPHRDGLARERIVENLLEARSP